MIVDFVRAGNDDGSLGFLAKNERLNVLLIRQEQHLFVIGDKKCCDSNFATALAKDPEVERSHKENEVNSAYSYRISLALRSRLRNNLA